MLKKKIIIWFSIAALLQPTVLPGIEAEKARAEAEKAIAEAEKTKAEAAAKDKAEENNPETN